MRSPGDEIASRRGELGLSQAELASASEVSSRTISAIERGESWTRTGTRARIERALLWRPGSLDAIKAGGEPTEMSVGEIKSLPDELVPPLVKKQLSAPKAAALEKTTNVGGRIIADTMKSYSLGSLLEEKFANLGLSSSAWARIAETAQATNTDEQRRDAAEQPGVDLGSLRESMRNLDELPGFVQAVILAQAEEELPRAIAALDEARRVELVRAAFALWDAQDGLGGAGAGVAGGRNRAAAAPHTGARRTVNERATGNAGAGA
ncbi:helix-turn-helix transcriptional regulator [Corynebacterium ulceribovis]|uniref:helix-turn-helix transcriptional regulator n=1 Tax=Corynebacterium ulceribovis TaxID=487732 RepID=UPI0003740E4C|nr:helix-turn-helix transcriptional regulator [Corynebacterium ulceribovis]